ncbi:MAG: hypothetical protein GAK30_00650 [Paracidovorax wautersii]|uniref:DUF4136 domain-containing protein n=1 Tax=Paracidovorax wautersii TaxID=1177982 RepID=A0A7V8FRE0_9BURK|nr:MAG: hypothetical protein GAK30_00650 [Paracidovorax wautersii]
MNTASRHTPLSSLGRWLPILAAAALLSACAATQLQTNVQAYSTLQALPAQANDRTYRFERLPSQQADAGQDDLERQARVALQKIGLALAGSPDAPTAQRPRYSVQVQLRQTVLPLDPYGFYGPDPFWGRGWGPGFYGAWAGPFWSSGRTETRSELTLLLRDLTNGQVVFEGHAVHSDLPVARNVLVPALLDAALRDFPQPPAGTRQVIVPLPAATR